MPVILGFMFILLGLAQASPTWAQDQAERDFAPILEGLDRSFAFPIEQWQTPPSDSVWRNLLAGFSGNLSATVPLDAEFGRGDGAEGEAEGATPTGGLSLRYTPIGHWFFALNVPYYWDSDRQAPWNGDFTYSFGFDDWHPYTFSLVYGNFGGNRFDRSEHPENRHTDFKSGTWTLAYKFPLAEPLRDILLPPGYGSIGCNIGMNYTSSTGKQTFSYGCRSSLPGFLYFSFTGYIYPDSSEQQPWDPDFTYGFGLFDWRPGRFSVTYSNYSGNRFENPLDGFESGSIQISYGWSL